MKTALLLFLFAPVVHSAILTYTNLPYRSRADSPFYRSIQAGTTLVEDFEDEALNTPSLSLPYGRVSSTGRFSVDEDDGKMDNLGVGFHWGGTGFLLLDESLYSNEIRFLKNVQGQFPQHAGLVLLGFVPNDLGGMRSFQAFDSDGVAIPEAFLSAPVPAYAGNFNVVSTV